MRNKDLTKLTLAGMLAAMAFICFAYLRIEIPMGGGLTGKIYIGHAFIMLAALLLGSKYGGLAGAIGLTLADILAGYTTSAPPTFLSKYIFGWSIGFIAHNIFHLSKEMSAGKINKIILAATIGGELINIVTEPLIRYTFKIYVLGMPQQLAYLSALNCAVAEVVSSIPTVAIAVTLYKVLEHSLLKNCRWE